MISSDLFGAFDPALVAQIQAGNAAHKAERRSAAFANIRALLAD